MACETPKGVMEQERAYLDALPAAAKYEVDGSNLTLLAADGTIVATLAREGSRADRARDGAAHGGVQNDQKTGTSRTATTPKNASIGSPSFQ